MTARERRADARASHDALEWLRRTDDHEARRRRDLARCAPVALLSGALIGALACAAGPAALLGLAGGALLAVGAIMMEASR